MPWASVGGYTLSALPYGAAGYPIALDCAEFRIYLCDSRKRPTAWVQVRSAFIHAVGVRGAVAESVRVAEAVLEAAVSEPHPSRADLYADIGGWRIVHDDTRGLVTKAKVRTVARSGTDELETIQVGKTPRLVRLYRKDLEVAAKGGHAPLFWGGYTSAVTRVEVQLGSEALHDFHFANCEEMFACTGDLWRYGVTRLVELREPGAGPKERWRLRPEWQLVQEVAIREFPVSGLVPFKVVAGRRDKVVAPLLGYLAAYAAFDGIEDPKAVLERLLREFPDLVIPGKGRTFMGEMLRRRASLPRAVRRLRDGLLPAGKERDARRSDLNNRITTDEVGGHA